MLLGDSVKSGEHQRQDDLAVLLNQTEDVLVIPEIKSPLCYLGHKRTPDSMTEIETRLPFFFFLKPFYLWEGGGVLLPGSEGWRYRLRSA